MDIMTPIETIAAIFGIAVVIKMLFLFLAPKEFLKFFNPMYKWIKKNYWPTTILMLILVGILANYIFAVLGIVEVAAVMMLTSILYGLTIMNFMDKYLDKVVREMTKKGAINKIWLPVLIWLILGIWVLYTLYM